MRKAGDVVFTDVDSKGGGEVDFSNREDMEYAIRSLDDTEFKNYAESSFIRVKAANKRRDRSEEGRGRKRSVSRSRSASRSRSPIRKRSPRSHSRSVSRSPSAERLPSAEEKAEKPMEEAAEPVASAEPTEAPAAAVEESN